LVGVAALISAQSVNGKRSGEGGGSPDGDPMPGYHDFTKMNPL
jgi:hypothetical protein